MNPRYGGSSNDSWVWSQSEARVLLKESYLAGSQYMLIGDSGYPLEPWLMTPILDAPNDTPEYHYTQGHSKARCCVENCIGHIKNIFRCVGCDNIARYEPSFMGQIFNVVCALYNMRLAERMDVDRVEAPLPDVPMEVPTQRDINRVRRERGVRQIAQRKRQQIVDNYFM